MKIWTAEILYKTNLMLGEGAHWHPRWQRFLYVDIEGRKVGCIDPVTKKIKEQNVGKRVGTVVPAADDHLIVALQGSIEELDFETGELRKLVSIEPGKPGNRSNDGKCDAAGRLWMGTMSIDAKLHEGALYRFDGKLEKMLGNTSVSNGICWSADHRKMYYIDSFDYHIKVFDFDVVSGNISNGRIIIEIEEPGWVPDGMTIDEEGMLWVAMWGGGCVHRYDPVNGLLIGKIQLPVPNVTSCAFGGENMKTLLITTARSGLDDEQLRRFPLSGSLFYIDSDITGAEMNSFIAKDNQQLVETIKF